MKHLLNDLSSDEKNRIREQYEGGMAVDNSKFKKLLESKLGDVKLLVMEQPTNKRVIKEDKVKDDASLNSIMNTVAKIMNVQIDKKIQQDPTFPTAKVTIKRTAKPDNIFYCWTYDGEGVGCEDLRINVNTLMASNGPLSVGNSIKNAFDASQNPNLPKKLRELPQPGLKSTVDSWINSHSQYINQQAVKK